MMDIPAWSKGTGNEFLLLDKEGDHFLFRVRRDK